jgi:hypothetical protein
VKVPRWVPEGVLIVASVALGFGAAQYGEYRDDRQLATRVLQGIEAELEQNLTLLEPMVPFHREWVDALGEAHAMSSQSGLDVWFATRPGLPATIKTPFPTPRRAAWDAALAGGSLRLLDYDITASLSELYRAQEILTDNVNRLASGALSQTATYDPASRIASVRLLWLTLADIHAAEAILLDLYRQHVPLLQDAVAAGRRTR